MVWGTEYHGGEGVVASALKDVTTEAWDFFLAHISEEQESEINAGTHMAFYFTPLI